MCVCGWIVVESEVLLCASVCQPCVHARVCVSGPVSLKFETYAVVLG